MATLFVYHIQHHKEAPPSDGWQTTPHPPSVRCHAVRMPHPSGRPLILGGRGHNTAQRRRKPVLAHEDTEWCTRMVMVAKNSDQPQQMVDYQRLSAERLRERPTTPLPHLGLGVPLHSYKTMGDAYWDFHQAEPNEDSRCLTTFITLWRRYLYCSTHMGHFSASDAYTRHFDDAIQ